MHTQTHNVLRAFGTAKSASNSNTNKNNRKLYCVAFACGVRFRSVWSRCSCSAHSKYHEIIYVRIESMYRDQMELAVASNRSKFVHLFSCKNPENQNCFRAKNKTNWNQSKKKRGIFITFSANKFRICASELLLLLLAELVVGGIGNNGMTTHKFRFSFFQREDVAMAMMSHWIMQNENVKNSIAKWVSATKHDSIGFDYAIFESIRRNSSMMYASINYLLFAK